MNLQWRAALNFALARGKDVGVKYAVIGHRPWPGGPWTYAVVRVGSPTHLLHRGRRYER